MKSTFTTAFHVWFQISHSVCKLKKKKKKKQKNRYKKKIKKKNNQFYDCEKNHFILENRDK